MAINPGFLKAYNNLGNIYIFLGENEKAVEILKRALEINPDSPEVHNNIAVAYFKLGEYDLAVKHYDRAIGLGCPVHPEFLEALKQYR